jgi:signal transduction histidine kinase
VSERERRSRAEREFVANAAHELLTPLTGIVGAAHVLEAGAKEVPEDRDHFIAHIARECSRLTQIARSLLVLARAQSGEEPPRLEILRLRKLLEQAAEQLDATVTIRCAGTVTVLADQDLFLQAAVNLVANSLQHGPGDGVSVEARAIASNLVQIDIVDADGKVPDVSEFRGRFRTGGGRDGGGFGLGLSIAAQSLEAMGGRLLFAGGATRVELPLGKVAS